MAQSSSWSHEVGGTESHPGEVHLLSREHQSGRTVSGSKFNCMARRVA